MEYAIKNDKFFGFLSLLFQSDRFERALEDYYDGAVYYSNYEQVKIINQMKSTIIDEINKIIYSDGYRLENKSSGFSISKIITDKNSILSSEVEALIENVNENETKKLLREAIDYFKESTPESRKIAAERLWDAFERLKTYYTALDKKASVTKIINDMSGQQSDYIGLFDDEFRALTKIGNEFRIRHHETNTINITDIRHYDYFFNRCLSLIALAIQYLEEGETE